MAESRIPVRTPVDFNAHLKSFVSTDGALVQVEAEGVVIVDGDTGIEVPVATETTLALIKAKTDNIDVALSTRAVTGLTDAQLRAAAIPVSAVSLPLPSGASSESTLALVLLAVDDVESKLDSIQAELSQKTEPANQQHVIIDSSALPADAATQTTLALIKAKTDNLDVALSTRAVTGLTDAQLRAAAVLVSAASLPLPSGASSESTLSLVLLAVDDVESKLDSIQAELNQKTEPANQQHAIVDSSALPADAATQTTLALIKAKTDNLDVALSSRAVTGLTDAQLRATAVPVAFDELDVQTAYDIGETVIYIGTAARGQPTSASAWKIKKTVLVAGNPTETKKTDADAVWNDRVTETYT